MGVDDGYLIAQQLWLHDPQHFETSDFRLARSRFEETPAWRGTCTVLHLDRQRGGRGLRRAGHRPQPWSRRCGPRPRRRVARHLRQGCRLQRRTDLPVRDVHARVRHRHLRRPGSERHLRDAEALGNRPGLSDAASLLRAVREGLRKRRRLRCRRISAPLHRRRVLGRDAPMPLHLGMSAAGATGPPRVDLRTGVRRLHRQVWSCIVQRPLFPGRGLRHRPDLPRRRCSSGRGRRFGSGLRPGDELHTGRAMHRRTRLPQFRSIQSGRAAKPSERCLPGPVHDRPRLRTGGSMRQRRALPAEDVRRVSLLLLLHGRNLQRAEVLDGQRMSGRILRQRNLRRGARRLHTALPLAPRRGSPRVAANRGLQRAALALFDSRRLHPEGLERQSSGQRCSGGHAPIRMDKCRRGTAAIGSRGASVTDPRPAAQQQRVILVSSAQRTGVGVQPEHRRASRDRKLELLEASAARGRAGRRARGAAALVGAATRNRRSLLTAAEFAVERDARRAGASHAPGRARVARVPTFSAVVAVRRRIDAPAPALERPLLHALAPTGGARRRGVVAADVDAVRVRPAALLARGVAAGAVDGTRRAVRKLRA